MVRVCTGEPRNVCELKEQPEGNGDLNGIVNRFEGSTPESGPFGFLGMAV